MIPGDPIVPRHMLLLNGYKHRIKENDCVRENQKKDKGKFWLQHIDFDNKPLLQQPGHLLDTVL